MATHKQKTKTTTATQADTNNSAAREAGQKITIPEGYQILDGSLVRETADAVLVDCTVDYFNGRCGREIWFPKSAAVLIPTSDYRCQLGDVAVSGRILDQKVAELGEGYYGIITRRDPETITDEERAEEKIAAEKHAEKEAERAEESKLIGDAHRAVKGPRRYRHSNGEFLFGLRLQRNPQPESWKPVWTKDAALAMVDAGDAAGLLGLFSGGEGYPRRITMVPAPGEQTGSFKCVRTDKKKGGFVDVVRKDGARLINHEHVF